MSARPTERPSRSVSSWWQPFGVQSRAPAHSRVLPLARRISRETGCRISHRRQGYLPFIDARSATPPPLPPPPHTNSCAKPHPPRCSLPCRDCRFSLFPPSESSAGSLSPHLRLSLTHKSASWTRARPANRSCPLRKCIRGGGRAPVCDGLPSCTVPPGHSPGLKRVRFVTTRPLRLGLSPSETVRGGRDVGAPGLCPGNAAALRPPAKPVPAKAGQAPCE